MQKAMKKKHCFMLSMCEKHYLHQPCTTLLNIHLRCGCPIPGSDKGQFGWDFEQPGGMEDVLAQGMDLDKMISKGALQRTPFCDSK